MRVLWLADALREYGLKVVEQPGWADRGASTLNPKVVVVHHTASKPPKPIPSLDVVVKGRSDVPGPLCNVLIGRDSTCHVIASGVSNNAGTGSWDGITGNRHTLGIEVENDGVGEPWSTELYETTVKAAAALRRGALIPTSRVVGHKEWTPRKIDPRFDMRLFRDAVDAAAPLGAPVPVAPVPEVPSVDYVSPSGSSTPLVPPPVWLMDLGQATVGVAANGNLYCSGVGAAVVEAAIEKVGYRNAFQARTVGKPPEWDGQNLTITSHLGEGYVIGPVVFTVPQTVDPGLIARCAACEQTIAIARGQAAELAATLG